MKIPLSFDSGIFLPGFKKEEAHDTCAFMVEMIQYQIGKLRKGDLLL